MFGYFSDKDFNARGGMLFSTEENKDLVVTTCSDAPREDLGRFVGKVTTFIEYRPSPKWTAWDQTYRSLKLL